MSLFFIFFMLIFITIFGMIIYTVIHGIATSHKNSNSPKMSVVAKLVNKRQKVRGDHSRTYYYLTFEYESGDRQEFQVSGETSGMLVEGDEGKLSFQGTRYLGFERKQ